jgi:hypothetical protein
MKRMASYKKRLLFFATFSLTILNFQTSFGSQPASLTLAAPRPPAGPKAACRIEVDDAHISSSALAKKGIRTVKVNAQSICNFRQQHVDLTVEIYKTTDFGNNFVTASSTNPKSPGSSGLVVDNFSTQEACKNSTPTVYYGIAFSQALIDGRIQDAGRTRSIHLTELKCGT